MIILFNLGLKNRSETCLPITIIVLFIPISFRFKTVKSNTFRIIEYNSSYMEINSD